MLAIWKWNLSQLARRIWVPIALYATLGVVTSVATLALKPLVPADLAGRIGAEAVSTLLQILASSMLAVTTFSLSIMTAAFGSAASGATPRAIALLKDDRVTQRVLATFMGAFLFSLSGLIGLQTGIYEASGRVILFVVTLAVLAAVVFQLVRWIGHLADYGRLSDTIGRVEAAAAASLSARMAQPFLGGRRLIPGVEADLGAPILAEATGYVQVIDMAGLNDLAQAAGVELALCALPGSFVHPGVPLLRLRVGARVGANMGASVGAGADVGVDAERLAALRRRFVIAPARNFEQDPRFGVLALTEIASRALSPAVNDPGTAIDILGRHLRILALWHERAEAEVAFPALWVPPLRLSDLMTDAFAAIARDGAGLIEVQIRLQKTLAGLVAQAPWVFGPDAQRLSDRALRLAEAALVLEEDRDALRLLAAEVAAAATGAAAGPVFGATTGAAAPRSA